MASTANAPVPPPDPGNDGATSMEGVLPTDDPSMAQLVEDPMDQTGDGSDPLELRVDPDNTTTVTDFLDFTEHLPSDMTRSLTLIGNLDQRYTASSQKINHLTTTWGQLPSLPLEQRPSAVQLRADISEQMSQAVRSRVFAHAEAVRMADNVRRHYNKARALLGKLQSMMDNYPTQDAKSPVQSKSPQMVRPKLGVRTAEGGQKIRRQRVPRITVPGEVLAPYDLDFDSFTDESDVSSDEDSETPPGNHRTPGGPKIKLLSGKPPKTPNRQARPVPFTSAAVAAAAAANAAALLNPPPDNAVIGSPDAPWLQLTQYELAKLRKRMKKNATWTPSETMIARELKILRRGPDAFREAKKKAEDEGEVFEPPVPEPVVDDESGTPQLPAGAISVDTLAAEEVPTTNRGMKLNEAKKLKREALAKQAADEAEASLRKMEVAAKQFLSGDRNQRASKAGASKEAGSKASKEATAKTPKQRTYSRSKRKRETEPETSKETQEPAETPSTRPQIKRMKTETPVHPPNYLNLSYGKRTTPDISASTPLLTPGGSVVHHSETPVPLPIPRGSSTGGAAISPPLKSPLANNSNSNSNNSNSNSNNSNSATASASTKGPATETPVPLPIPERRKSVTPVLPPIREAPVREPMIKRESFIKRETRGDAAKRNQQQQSEPPEKQATPTLSLPQVVRLSPVPEPVIKQDPSRAPTPQVLSIPEKEPARRPGSRGKATSQEPQPSLAADRPRRASTARNTPAPEVRQPSKRTKRPAPGVVSVTRSGGNSAVGRRKAAPKKKTRQRKDKGQETYEEDDEGNIVDSNETRYCSCNRVSFGAMIQCENSDNCKGDWFHLKCVGLEEIPARTTKWYCPECRVLLNIGEKGEVNARGVKT